MNTRIHTARIATLAMGMLLLATVTSFAASISYVGAQMNIEDDANTPTDGWRNPTTVKPLDAAGLDGPADNILGTDGWYLANTNQAPGYATTTVTGSTFGPYGAGLWDDPADPSGADTIGQTTIRQNGGYVLGTLSNSLLQFAVTGTDLNDKTLRLGVLSDWFADNDTSPNSYLATYTISQIAGVGSDTVTSAQLTYTGGSLDVAFFDIEGALAGDTFIVQTTVISAPGFPSVSNFQQFVGLTYDSYVPVPEPSTVILAGLGLAGLILRRRR